MHFTFPKNKAIHKGILKNFTIRSGGQVRYKLIDENDPLDNLINLNGIDYYFTYLNSDGRNKGGNSIILKLYESQYIDTDDLNYGNPNLILKILKQKKTKKSKFRKKIEKRFLKEIIALKTCKKSKHPNIIEIYDSGICSMYDPYQTKYLDYIYYTMEYAESDLKEYIEQNHDQLKLENKISLCISLARGIKQLYDSGYYHRDIKPDNIFMIGNFWKIGDLGLISERNTDDEVDDLNDFIGPRGWVSPEAMNKYLCEEKKFPFDYDCNIDHKSDIFQLGKVFWYIFQYNAPTGTVKLNDFRIRNNQIYPILKTMINYNKSRRYKEIDDVIHLLKPLEQEALLKSS